MKELNISKNLLNFDFIYDIFVIKLKTLNFEKKISNKEVEIDDSGNFTGFTDTEQVSIYSSNLETLLFLTINNN